MKSLLSFTGTATELAAELEKMAALGLKASPGETITVDDEDEESSLQRKSELSPRLRMDIGSLV